MTFTFGLSRGDRLHRADHGCAAGHVVLHLLHAVAGLDGDAAGVEGNAFADQAHHRRALGFSSAFRLVGHHDQRWWFGRALGDAPERAHLQFMQFVRAVDFALQPAAFAISAARWPRMVGVR